MSIDDMTPGQLADHLGAIADLVGESEDPGAAWEAVNALRERAERAEQLLEERRWISVEERLPEADGVYLGWATYPAGILVGEHETDVERCLYERGKWEVINNGDYVDGVYGNNYPATVTHWMPLPAAPDAQEGEG